MDYRIYKEQARRRAAQEENVTLSARLSQAKDLLARYAEANGDDPERLLALLDSYPMPADPLRWQNALAYYLMVWLNTAPHPREAWETFAAYMVEVFRGYGVTREDILKYRGRRR